MRRAGLLSCAAVAVLLVGSAFAVGRGDLSGSFTSQIAWDALSSVMQTDSRKSFAELAVSYEIDAFTLSSMTYYDFVSGVVEQDFGVDGAFGAVPFESRLSLAPVAGTTVSLTKSVNSPTHSYNLGRSYFVDEVEVTSLTLDDNVNTKWRVRVSADGTSWEWVSSEFTGNAAVPVVIPVLRLVRYIEIVTTVGGFVDDSAIKATISGAALVTTLELPLGGVTLGAELSLATGGTSLEFTLEGTEEGSLLDKASLTLAMNPSTCVLGFSSADIELDVSFACFEELSIDIGFECGEGFDDLALTAQDLPTGLAWLEFDLAITFSVSEKQIRVTPSVELEETGTCVTPYFQLRTGATTTELEGLTLYGLQIRESVNGVTFESLSYFDDLHHTKEDYWEKLSICMDGDACCGGGFSVEFALHFGKTHITLFDWAELEVGTELEIGSSLVLGGYMSILPAGLNEIIVGFEFDW